MLLEWFAEMVLEKMLQLLVLGLEKLMHPLLLEQELPMVVDCRDGPGPSC